MLRRVWLVPLCSSFHGFHTVLGELVDDPFVCGTSCAAAGQGTETAQTPTPNTKSSRTKLKKRRIRLQDKRRNRASAGWSRTTFLRRTGSLSPTQLYWRAWEDLA